MKEIIRFSYTALDPRGEEITSWLMELRKNSNVAESHFAVSAVIETFQHDKYVYIAGVNVENPEHNRLGLHAEQTAMSLMQALYGKNAQISKIWIMGAPDAAKKGDKSHPVTPCGACRQILMAFSNKYSRVYAVTLDGKVHDEFTLPESLPKSFDESALAINDREIKADISSQKNSAFDLFAVTKTLTSEQCREYLYLLQPRIIENQYRTSPVVAAILRLTNGAYAPGVLAEDIGFLTTDAVFAALAGAMVRFGAERKVRIAEIYLCGDKENITDDELLKSAEITWLRHFADYNIPLFYFLTPEKTSKQIHQTTLNKCAESVYKKLFPCAPVIPPSPLLAIIPIVNRSKTSDTKEKPNRRSKSAGRSHYSFYDSHTLPSKPAPSSSKDGPSIPVNTK